MPTAQHIDGFFHGMAHAAKIARQTGRGLTAEHAITVEITTLKLFKEAQDERNSECKTGRFQKIRDVRLAFAERFSKYGSAKEWVKDIVGFACVFVMAVGFFAVLPAFDRAVRSERPPTTIPASVILPDFTFEE
ncbi:MAG: hypothetical protein DI551_10445 [Micavibrio aeruginosavorus]|uniref:Uncharacterized protein n=1 Tax=Micavibrio aeruginosavorus TaxID=349221 RepID=A0A2W5N062_9BACT|nr:MAG: hypothetical protein DI551_10445 [Micavibrio aeruginosavorus]